MQSSRVSKSIKNVTYGLVIQAITVFINFAARICLVRVLGREVNGLNGLFTEVIAMLSLAEMGVGAAITYSLYKPLAENDEQKLSEFMWLFKIAYRAIAVAIFVIGAAVTPVVNHLVKETSFTDSYIRIVFFLFVMKTASTYLYSYKTSLLIADQRNYVVSLITVVCNTVLTGVNIAILFMTHNFVIYLSVIITFSFVTNVCISFYADRHYSFLKLNNRLSKDECKKVAQNIKHIFIAKLSSKITNSTDNILVSVLVNTVSTGIYSNYAMIMTNIKQVLTQMMSSMTGGLGNLLVSESPRHCSNVLKRLTFMFFVAGIVFGGGILCASKPFIELCFGKECLLDETVLFVCSFNLYLFVWINPLWNVMGVSGLFSDDKKTSIAGSLINLIVSFILGKKIGMAGIFIGTTCTLVIQIVMKIFYLYKKRFQLPYTDYLFYSLKMMAIVLLMLVFEKWVCSLIVINSLVADFVVKGIVSTAMSLAAVLLIYWRSSEFHYFVNFIKKRVSSALGKKASV